MCAGASPIEPGLSDLTPAISLARPKRRSSPDHDTKRGALPGGLVFDFPGMMQRVYVRLTSSWCSQANTVSPRWFKTSNASTTTPCSGFFGPRFL